MRAVLYLAGPDVFLPDAREVGRRKRELCREAGFEGLFPLDNDAEIHASPGRIFAANCALMRRATVGVCNLTPFRGPGADPGTAFEMGFMFAQGKPVFGYTADCRLYRQRVPGTPRSAHEPPRDPDGYLIEDFDLIDNLMLTRAADESGGRLMAVAGSSSPGAGTDLAAFEAFSACLAAIATLLGDRAGA